MKPDEFRAKHSKKQITDFLYGLDIDADHEDDPEWTEFYRDVVDLLVELFPDCDWRN